jgi:hypothetical protein
MTEIGRNIKNYVSNFQEENEYKQRMLDFLDNCENHFSRETKADKRRAFY